MNFLSMSYDGVKFMEITDQNIAAAEQAYRALRQQGYVTEARYDAEMNQLVMSTHNGSK